MRRRRADRREIEPDPRFRSELLARLVNSLMERGKKSTAEGIVYGALEDIKEMTKQEDAVQVLQQAIDNVKPRLEVKSRRVGGATYQVPVEVHPDRQVALALRWILDYASGRKGVSMPRVCQDRSRMSRENKMRAKYRASRRTLHPFSEQAVKVVQATLCVYDL